MKSAALVLSLFCVVSFLFSMLREAGADVPSAEREDSQRDVFDPNDRLDIRSPTGILNVRAGGATSFPNRGGIVVCDEWENRQALLCVDIAHGHGAVGTKGANGQYYTVGLVDAEQIDPGAGYNRGFVAVAGEEGPGYIKAGMYVDSLDRGVVFGDTKNLLMRHPDKPDSEIWYTCIEGPEAAAYVRGTAQLVNGEAVVRFPEHFRAAASNTGITAYVNPLSPQSKGLAVTGKAVDHICVQELQGGKGSYDFDYMIMAVRRGYEDYQVVRRSAGPRRIMQTDRPPPNPPTQGANKAP